MDKQDKVKKDLGVRITDNLSSEKHINKITGDIHQLLRNTKIVFKYLNEEMIRKLITSLIRPKLECASVIWSSHIKDTKSSNKNGSKSERFTL